MQEYRDIYEWRPPESGCAIALGRFDGVHLGHRALLERAVEHASEHNLVPVCFSFREDTYPKAKKYGQLTTSDEKAEILESIGIEVLLHPAFEPPLIDMSAMEFLSRLVVGRWKAKLVVAGFDFHFGRDRGGDASLLKAEGERLGVEVEVFKAFKAGGEAVKATRIRRFIADGHIDKANALLGRPYSIRAETRGGRQFGRSIGFPTINFEFPPEKVKPGHGVYAVRLRRLADGLILSGVANYGLRPTIEPDNVEPLLEVHLLDGGQGMGPQVDQIPPGTSFEVQLLVFIREERRFDSIEELKEQIEKDCRIAKGFFVSS